MPPACHRRLFGWGLVFLCFGLVGCSSEGGGTAVEPPAPRVEESALADIPLEVVVAADEARLSAVRARTRVLTRPDMKVDAGFEEWEQKAHRLFDEGVSAYDEREFEQAVRHFKAAEQAYVDLVDRNDAELSSERARAEVDVARSRRVPQVEKLVSRRAALDSAQDLGGEEWVAATRSIDVVLTEVEAALAEGDWERLDEQIARASELLDRADRSLGTVQRRACEEQAQTVTQLMAAVGRIDPPFAARIQTLEPRSDDASVAELASLRWSEDQWSAVAWRSKADQQQASARYHFERESYAESHEEYAQVIAFLESLEPFQRLLPAIGEQSIRYGPLVEELERISAPPRRWVKNKRSKTQRVHEDRCVPGEDGRMHASAMFRRARPSGQVKELRARGTAALKALDGDAALEAYTRAADLLQKEIEEWSPRLVVEGVFGAETVDGLTVEIDDKRVGELPLTRPAKLGETYRIRVHGDVGGQPVWGDRYVMIVHGFQTRARVLLHRKASLEERFETQQGGIELVRIEPGRFYMGSRSSEKGRNAGETDEGPRRRVQIERPFAIGKYELTRSQYAKVMGQAASQEDPLPARIGWTYAVRFCTVLTLREREAGRVPGGYEYRLPTEAEWEYCCRAGSKTRYAFGDNLTAEQANHDLNRLVAVGSYPPNAWGLHDMHGNCREWCLDVYYPYSKSDTRDPFRGERLLVRGFWVDIDRKKIAEKHRWKPDSAISSRDDRRVSRGGGPISYSNWPEQCRSASRRPMKMDSTRVGFRIVLGPIVHEAGDPTRHETRRRLERESGR